MSPSRLLPLSHLPSIMSAAAQGNNNQQVQVFRAWYSTVQPHRNFFFFFKSASYNQTSPIDHSQDYVASV